MKPNFALTLSFEGIGLLHRAFPGWHLVGEVQLDSADLTGDLAALRDKAHALDASGLRSKLVIPNDQIKYIQFDTEGLDTGDLDAHVRRHLDGATPYAIDDMACDWSVSAGQAYVAAVARETLAEAENFATEHAFNPLCFVAIPDSRQFVGEPYFGDADRAASHLPEGDAIERDTAAIRVIGTADLPEPEPAAEDTSAPAPDFLAKDEAVSRDVIAPQTPPPEAPDPAREPAAPADQAETPTEPAPAFHSIRASRDDIPAAAPPLQGAARDIPRHFTPIAETSDTPDTPAPETPEDLPAVTGTPEAALPEEQVADFAATLRPDPAERLQAAVAHVPEDDDTQNSSFFTRRQVRPEQAAAMPLTPAAAAATITAPDTEPERMTVFGVRNSAEPLGRPRYLALILTAVLLLFLVAVAAWASIFLDEGIARFFRPPANTEIATVPDEALGELPRDALPAEDPEATEDTVVASLPQDSSVTDLPAKDPLPEPAPAELSPDQARARYAATGIWQMAPDPPHAPGFSSLDDFYQTSIDPMVITQDAVALPEAELPLTDSRPPTPAEPPAPGTTFNLDSRGLVIATPEGTLTPDGVLVIAGKPALLPPPIPKRIAPPTSEEAAAPSVATIRPRLRPTDLSEQNERGTLGGRTKSELAALRPRLRPQSAQEAAQEAAEAAAGTGEQTDPADPFAGATDEAVVASLKPRTRPQNFARIVNRSQQEAAAQPVSASQKVAPSIPSSASVARAATEKNKIALKKVNLIGVYGTPSNRRALVRMANGRYKKVKVGDKLDGGKVAAIGDDELRYVKRGRSVVLRMPKG